MRIPGRLVVVGFRRWRQAALRPLLRERAESLLFVPDVAAAAALQPTPEDALLCWGLPAWARQLEQLASSRGARSLRMEDGFFRSVGLGSDLIPPRSVVFDDTGIYFDPSRPSQLENLLLGARYAPHELERAATLRALIVRTGLTKYNLGHTVAAMPDWRGQAAGRPVILVPGQVEDDASVLCGGAGVRTNADLLAAVRAARPGAFLVYRPHPDVLAGNRRGGRPLHDVLDIGTPLHQALDAVDEVHTLTSLTGFDALLRGLHVVTYGTPFYAGWGLTEDLNLLPDVSLRRSRKLQLDELVHGTLVDYATYWDPDGGGGCTPEQTLEALLRDRSGFVPGGPLRRIVRKASALIRGAGLFVRMRR